MMNSNINNRLQYQQTDCSIGSVHTMAHRSWVVTWAAVLASVVVHSASGQHVPTYSELMAQLPAMMSPDHRQAISKLTQLLAGYDEPLNRRLWMSVVPGAWREAEAPGDGPVTEVEGTNNYDRGDNKYPGNDRTQDSHGTGANCES